MFSKKFLRTALLALGISSLVCFSHTVAAFTPFTIQKTNIPAVEVKGDAWEVIVDTNIVTVPKLTLTPQNQQEPAYTLTLTWQRQKREAPVYFQWVPIKINKNNQEIAPDNTPLYDELFAQITGFTVQGDALPGYCGVQESIGKFTDRLPRYNAEGELSSYSDNSNEIGIYVPYSRLTKQLTGSLTSTWSSYYPYNNETTLLDRTAGNYTFAKTEGVWQARYKPQNALHPELILHWVPVRDCGARMSMDTAKEMASYLNQAKDAVGI